MSTTRWVVSSFVVIILVLSAIVFNATRESSGIYVLRSEPDAAMVYTNRGGCNIRVSKSQGSLLIEAEGLDLWMGLMPVRQSAVISIDVTGRIDGKPIAPGEVIYFGAMYDRTKRDDLLNKRCRKLIEAIPDNTHNAYASMVLTRQLSRQ